MHPVVANNLGQIHALCREYGVARLELFGSAASGAFDESRSDVDFLVTFADKANYFDRYMGLVESLERTLGRHVDMVTSRSMRNPYFKAAVDAQRLSVYDRKDPKTSDRRN